MLRSAHQTTSFWPSASVATATSFFRAPRPCRVGMPKMLVALAARHLRQLGCREHQQSPLADYRGDNSAVGRAATGTGGSTCAPSVRFSTALPARTRAYAAPPSFTMKP